MLTFTEVGPLGEWDIKGGLPACQHQGAKGSQGEEFKIERACAHRLRAGWLPHRPQLPTCAAEEQVHSIQGWGQGLQVAGTLGKGLGPGLSVIGCQVSGQDCIGESWRWRRGSPAEKAMLRAQ